MKATTLVMTALLWTGASFALAQASVDPVESPTVVTGQVVRYEPNKILVIRHHGKEVAYTLGPSVTIPSDVQVGKTVAILAEQSGSGLGTAAQVTVTCITPEGKAKGTTE